MKHVISTVNSTDLFNSETFFKFTLFSSIQVSMYVPIIKKIGLSQRSIYIKKKSKHKINRINTWRILNLNWKW